MENSIIIGAGPAGLTAALELIKYNRKVTILEKDPEYLGGISKTVEYKGYRFDLGGHRFYTKYQSVQKLWEENLKDDFLEVPRSSSIYFNNKFFPYPLEIKSTLKEVGIIKSISICYSFLMSQGKKNGNILTLEDAFINCFGKELYKIFFKDYSENVWGIPCNKISKDWFKQRIRGFSLKDAVLDALKPSNKYTKDIMTIIKTFYYPRYGPGQMWDSFSSEIINKGNTILKNKNVVKIHHKNRSIKAVETDKGELFEGDNFFSSMPLKELIFNLEPGVPHEILHSASELSYRSFLIICLVIKKEDIFGQNWIYINNSSVKVCRIQNYKNWSKYLVPDQSTTCIGLEYYCNTNDDLWNTSDGSLIDLAVSEINILRMAEKKDIIDGIVIRVPDAYPIYSLNYNKHKNNIKAWLRRTLKNLYPIGRSGMHSYHNMDHAMMTSIFSVDKKENGSMKDPWLVNLGNDYLEKTINTT
jgi:protoporphyrinogen oxidase